MSDKNFSPLQIYIKVGYECSIYIFLVSNINMHTWVYSHVKSQRGGMFATSL